MKIAYIVTGLNAQETTNETTDSIRKNDKDATVFLCLYSEGENEMEKVNERISSLDDTFTHVCIIPDGSVLSDNYLSIISQYVKEDITTIFLPLTSLYYDPEAADKFRGFLNSVVWKPQMAEVVGELTMRVATRQIDTTLYGALIPAALIKTEKLNTEIKFFSHFEFLNRVVSKDVLVLGVPKMLFSLYKDYELKAADKDEKIKNFEAARAEYMPKMPVPGLPSNLNFK